VAGSLVIFVVAVEMTFDVSLFKLKGPQGMAAIVPIVFPFIAGAASFTTLLSLRAEYALSNILVALLLNVVVIYLVIWKINILEKVLGAGGVYILRKFFGIILLAIAVKLFTSNLSSLLTTN
jgi:multiple antibiotic resistance protein